MERLRPRPRALPCFPGAAHPCASDLIFRPAGAFFRSASVKFVPAPYNDGAHRPCENYRPLCRRLPTQNAALFTENKRTICPSRPDAVLSNEAARGQGCEVAHVVAQSSRFAKFIGQRCTPLSLNPLVSMTFGCCCIVRLRQSRRT